MRDVVEEIRKRPVFYLGFGGVSSLSSFLNGYNLAVRKYGIQDLETDRFFDGFPDFFASRYPKVSSEGKHWIQTLSDIAAETGEAELDIFFRLFFEFMDE